MIIRGHNNESLTMIKNYIYYELFASISVPNPNEVGYWVDLGADALGNVIKFYDPKIRQWVKLTDASSEYAVSPRIAANGNWFVDNRDTGIPASGKNPYIGDNGNWYVFDAKTNKYIDTNIIAKGKSAYDIAKDYGFIGTEAEWLTSLKSGAAEAAARANQATTLANSAASRANRIANNPPKIVGEYWAIYDEITNSYVTSEFPSRGPAGSTGLELRSLWGNEFNGSQDVTGDIVINNTFIETDSNYRSQLTIGETGTFWLRNIIDSSNENVVNVNGSIFAGDTQYGYGSINLGTTGVEIISDSSINDEEQAATYSAGISLKSWTRPKWLNFVNNNEYQLILPIDFDNNSIIHDNGNNIRINPAWITSETDLSNYLPLSGGTMSGKLVLNTSPTSANDAVTKDYVDQLITELNNDALTFVGIVSTTEPTVDVRENNFWYNGNLTDALPWTVKVYTAGVWEDRVDPYQPTAMDLWSVNGVDAYYYLGQTWHQIDFNGSTFDLTKFSITDGVVSIKPGSLVDTDVAAGANIAQSKVAGLTAISSAIPALQSSVSSLTTTLSNKLDKSTQSNVVYVNSSDIPTVVSYAFEVKPDAIIRRNHTSQIAVNPNEDTSKDVAIGAKQVMSLIGNVSGNPALLDFISNSSTVTSLANLNLNYATIYCSISSDQTISVASKRFDNLSTQIYITNTSTSSITMSIPNEPSFISVSGQSVTIPANSYTECSIMYDAILMKYRVVFFYNESIELTALQEEIDTLTQRVTSIESIINTVNTQLDTLLRES